MAIVTVSVVIPTRNRAESLRRILGALAQQDRKPEEVIVTDASDRPSDESALAAAYPTLRITRVSMAPSVCRQRNTGIRLATGSHVLLCDDDIEPPRDYIRRLVAHLDAEPSAGAVTGIWIDAEAETAFERRTPTFRSLLFAVVFQLTVWADVEAVRRTRLTSMPLSVIKRWYRHRGNTWSAAGWPLVTQVRTPVMQTAAYSLGAALVRREWLLASPFDERLGPHGIGDNYGVALGFPSERGIAVLTDLVVRHHRAHENRLDARDTYVQRVLALDHFMQTSPRFSALNRICLRWSLLGQIAQFVIARQRDLVSASIRATLLVVTRRNPLNAGPQRSSTPDLSHVRTPR